MKYFFIDLTPLAATNLATRDFSEREESETATRKNTFYGASISDYASYTGFISVRK